MLQAFPGAMALQSLLLQEFWSRHGTYFRSMGSHISVDIAVGSQHNMKKMNHETRETKTGL
jgi:hypothetical protein